jgi:hypothetical protein
MSWGKDTFKIYRSMELQILCYCMFFILSRYILQETANIPCWVYGPLWAKIIFLLWGILLNQPAWILQVFIEYSDTLGSAKAKSSLHGRKFGGNVAVAVYYSEEAFTNGDYGCWSLVHWGHWYYKRDMHLQISPLRGETTVSHLHPTGQTKSKCSSFGSMMVIVL